MNRRLTDAELRAHRLEGLRDRIAREEAESLRWVLALACVVAGSLLGILCL